MKKDFIKGKERKMFIKQNEHVENFQRARFSHKQTIFKIVLQKLA